MLSFNLFEFILLEGVEFVFKLDNFLDGCIMIICLGLINFI